MIRGKPGETRHYLCECHNEPSCRRLPQLPLRHYHRFIANVNGVHHFIDWNECSYYGIERGYTSKAELVYRVTGFDVVAKGDYRFRFPKWMSFRRFREAIDSLPIVYLAPGGREWVLRRDVIRACLPRPRCDWCRDKISFDCETAIRGDNPGATSYEKLFHNEECKRKWLQRQREIERERMAQELAEQIRLRDELKKEQEAAMAAAILKRQWEAAERLRRQQQSKRTRRLRQLVWSVRQNLNDRNALASLKEEFVQLQNSPE